METSTSNQVEGAPALLELVTAIRGRVTSVTELALAEARLAAMSVALMVFVALIAAAFVLGAWGLCVAGMVAGLLMLDVSLWAALLGLAVLHGLMARVLWIKVLSLSGHLEFRATRKHLGLTSGVV